MRSGWFAVCCCDLCITSPVMVSFADDWSSDHIRSYLLPLSSGASGICPSCSWAQFSSNTSTGGNTTLSRTITIALFFSSQQLCPSSTHLNIRMATFLHLQGFPTRATRYKHSSANCCNCAYSARLVSGQVRVTMIRTRTLWEGDLNPETSPRSMMATRITNR